MSYENTVQEKWENKRADDCAEAGQPKCRYYPDHNCGECHEDHREEGEFNVFCSRCDDEKCPDCKGFGFITTAPTVTSKCLDCDGIGRTH